MSAIVCGKRSLFEDLHSPPPVSKRLRCAVGGGTSPIRFSPTRAVLSSSPLHHSLEDTDDNPAFSHLRALFPDMDDQILERALEACGNNLDSAIKSLNELCLGSADRPGDSPASLSDSNMGVNVQLSPEGIGNNGVEEPSPPMNNNLPVDGSEWVELFVREMMNASDMDDARARAAGVLEVLEKSIMSRAGAVTADNLHKENLMLKEQMELLIRDNSILKRAVTIQHERQKEHDERNQEVQHLKQLVSQYQEQLRTLEVNNYALTMHLREKLHAQVGRYKSPDEHPFFASDLPEPSLPPLQYPQVLHPIADSININKSIWDMYFDDLLPRLVKEGDDGNCGSTAVCDTICLQALSKRIHYGKFVAEAKFRAFQSVYESAIRAQDGAQLLHLLTYETVEDAVKKRVEMKAATYGQEVSINGASKEGDPMYKIQPSLVAALYGDWIMPLTKQVQVQYLLRRLD